MCRVARLGEKFCGVGSGLAAGVVTAALVNVCFYDYNKKKKDLGLGRNALVSTCIVAAMV